MKFITLKPNIYGALMVSLVAVLTALSNSITHALPASIATPQVVFFKSVVGLIILCGLNASRLSTLYKTKIIKWHAFKGVMGVVGNLMWVLALRHLPLASASGLSMTSALLTAFGGWVLFQEPFRKSVLSCLIIGFIGALIIINPMGELFTLYALLPLGSAAAFSISSLTIKRLARNDASKTTLFYLLLFMTLFSLPSALMNWQSLDWLQIKTLGAIGVLFVISQLCLIEAYSAAEASFIASFKYIRFPTNILAGLLFFTEIPAITTIIGGCMIICASGYLVIVERKQKKKPKKINS